MAGFFKNLLSKFSRSPKIDWDELEAELVTSDIGIKRAMSIVDQLRDMKGVDAENITSSTKEVIRRVFPTSAPALPPPPMGRPLVIIVVGVNGTGKTTSAAKLAHLLQKQGKSVLLAAADTFRAAAVEQLQSWAEKLNIPMYKGNVNQDPASVCYEAHAKALREGTQYLICDTAGRLHTRHNLMEELSKIRRTLAKQDETAPHYTLLVVDATTGANALAQAKEFHKATPLDSVIITKMDGSGKGGIAVAIMDEMNIAPAYLGTGEGADDFEPFDRDRYVDSLL
ncbi:MAG: signal recognition particle-docking protein FtsY [Akkermansia sp.]|nr:signal recognition particle-docking protein FtsY [Akkermansia sp.]